MTKAIKDQLVLILGVEEPGNKMFYDPEGYFHVNVHVGRLVDEREYDAHYRSDGTTFITPEDGGGFRIRDLIYSSQGDKKSPCLYGTGVRYKDVHSVELRDAEAMAKTLRTIENRMKTMTEKFGYPSDFVEEVMRFGQAIGAKRVFFRVVDTRSGRDASKSEWDSRLFGTEARYAIHWVVRHALERFGKQEPKEAPKPETELSHSVEN